MENQEPPPARKTKVDTCASHTEHVICRVCGIEILTKNYGRHLASQHPSEDRKNLKPKNVFDMAGWLAGSNKRKACEQSDIPPKRRNLSGDSGINDSDVDSDDGETSRGVDTGAGSTTTAEAEDRGRSEDTASEPGGPGESPEDTDTINILDDDNRSSIKSPDQMRSSMGDMTGLSLRRELSLSLTSGGDNDGAGAGQDDSCNRDMLLSNFLQNQNNEKDNRVTQLQNPGPGFQTENDANPEEVVSNSDILKAVVEGNLLQHQQNVAIQRVFDLLDKLNLSKPSGSVGAAAAASSTQDQDVVVTDFREIKSADDLRKFGFTFSAENKVVLCDLCQTEFKYSGLDYEGDIQSRDFINLKKNLKAHLQSQKHVAKEVQMKKEKEKTKKLLK